MSHATTDKWLATVLCEKIEECGATFFRDDRDIDGGDDIPEAIRDAMDDCQELLVLLTPESVGRQWVQFEIGAAWQRRVMWITVLRQHVTIDPIPSMLKSKRALDLNEFPRFQSDLRNRINKAR